MGACLSKKKGSATASNAVSTAPVQIQTPSQLKISGNGVTISLSKPTNPEVNLKKEKKRAQEEESDQLAARQECDQSHQTQVKKEIFIIKHRKSHDESKEKSSKIQPFSAQQNVSPHSDDGLPSNAATKIAPSTPNNIGVNVRTSSCTKEEVDAILIQCGRLSRSSSGRAATSSAGGRKYSGSKRSFDFDHCDNNDANSADDDQRRANAVSATDNSDLCEDYDGVAAEKRHHRHQHRQRHRQSPRPSPSRRRTPSRERDQQHQQRSSSRERRVSRSPGRRSSETNSSANGANASNAGNNSNNNTGSRPGKMVSVPATVSSLVVDKSNNGVGGGESAAATGIKRTTVKRNVGDCGMVGSRGSASPRSQSPARGNGNAANAKVVSDNHQHQQQQQPSLSRNNSARKAEQSPYRRNPLSEIDPNSLAYPLSNTNNGSRKVQNKPKKEIEAEANQNPYALEKGVNCKTKEQQEEDIKVMASMNDNVVVKTMVPSGAENLKPQTLTRSRSSRRSRDLDLNPEALLNNQTQSYTSLLLEDIQNFHQKNTQPSISLPACLSKACSILEAVADLNNTTSTNFSGAFSDDKRTSPTSYRNEHNAASLGANNHYYGKNRVPDTKDPFVESEVHVNDDVIEPSLHKYVTVKRGGSVCGVEDMEGQESSGSNSFIVSSNSGQQQQHRGICISSSSWEPNSADSTDCWTSRLMEVSDASAEARKALNCKRRECDDHQHSSGIGRGRLSGSSSSNKGLHHTLPVVTAAAAST